MTFGLVAAEMPAATLVAALNSRAPRIVDRGPCDPRERLECNLQVGELDGRSYIFDGILFSSEPDLLADIAAATGKLVVGCGADTLSGTFYCIVTRGATIVRHYFVCWTDMSRPYSFGTPFPSEKETPLETSSGEGFDKLLRLLGFDFKRWEEQAESRQMDWIGETKRLPAGPLKAAVVEHRARWKLAPQAQPTIKVRISDADTGEVIDLTDTDLRLSEGRAKREKRKKAKKPPRGGHRKR